MAARGSLWVREPWEETTAAQKDDGLLCREAVSRNSCGNHSTTTRTCSATTHSAVRQNRPGAWRGARLLRRAGTAGGALRPSPAGPGAAAGERIVLALPDCPGFVYTFLGALRQASFRCSSARHVHGGIRPRLCRRFARPCDRRAIGRHSERRRAGCGGERPARSASG